MFILYLVVGIVSLREVVTFVFLVLWKHLFHVIYILKEFWNFRLYINQWKLNCWYLQLVCTSFVFNKQNLSFFRRTCFMVLSLRVEPISLNAYLTNYILLDTTRQLFQVSLFFRSTLSLSGSVKLAKKWKIPHLLTSFIHAHQVQLWKCSVGPIWRLLQSRNLIDKWLQRFYWVYRS